MTDDEKAEMLASLVRSQNLLRDVQETIEAVAVSTKEVGESGLAFALLMVKESIGAYSKALAKFVESAVDE
jgi:uncharacterized RmlC-like cupin family protein